MGGNKYFRRDFVKNFYDIKRILDDRLSLASSQIYELARNILDVSTESIAEYLYLHPGETITTAYISFERDPIIEDFAFGLERDDMHELDVILALEDRDTDARSRILDACLMPTGISREAYEANRYSVTAKIHSLLEAEGYKVLDTNSDDVLVVDLR